MKDELIRFCHSINIEYVGIAPTEPYLDFERVWRRQLERGYTSGFEEKDIERRVYPHLTMADAKSVIVCLFPYLSQPCEDANLTKSAYGLDYHILVKEKLTLIERFLESKTEGIHCKAFVDNGPFSDRHLAYKAGLGFWGINNHIINDKYGSYFFIGYILNNYPYEADKPLNRTCKKCMNCVQQCPGQCILGDFTINAQRCKSYITQKKAELTDVDKSILKKHHLIWGCDVCQDVCPHNKDAEKTPLEEFKKDLKCSLNYDELEEISNKEFLRRYGNRAFSWRGKGVLKRNYEIINGQK